MGRNFGTRAIYDQHKSIKIYAILKLNNICNGVEYPVEVKSHLKTANVPDGLLKFLKKYPKAPFAVVFNENLKIDIKVEGRVIYFKHWQDVLKLDFLKTII